MISLFIVSEIADTVGLSSPSYYLFFIYSFVLVHYFFWLNQVYFIILFLYTINRWFMINCIFYDFFQGIIRILDLIQSILTFVLLLSDILFAYVINPTDIIISCYMKQSIVFHVYPHIYTFQCSSLLLLVSCFYMIISSHCFGSVGLLVKTYLILTFLKIALFCFHF